MMGRTTTGMIVRVGILLILALGIPSVVRGASVKDATESPAPRPAWCEAGWICLPRSEVTQATVKLIELKEEVTKLRLKAKRFGCAAGVGLGVSGVVTENWDVKGVPAGHAGITCGILF